MTTELFMLSNFNKCVVNRKNLYRKFRWTLISHNLYIWSASPQAYLIVYVPYAY